MYNVLLSSLRNGLEGLVPRNLCVKSPHGLKKRDRLAIVCTEQSEFVLPIYSYVQGTYGENITQDNINKMADESFILF